MSRRRIAAVTAAATLALTGALASSAQGAFHLMKVKEVFLGSAGNNNAFVELQMTEAGQNQTAGQKVRFWNAAGTLLGESPVLPNVGIGESQRTVLIGDTAVPGRDATYDMITETVSGVGAGGAMCFTGSADCVAWGAFASPGVLLGPVGNPAPAIPLGQSLNRLITANCATLLEEADDSNNSVADFALAAPTPVGNASTPTETPCGTCKKQQATIVGTEGPDTLNGTPGKDVVSALGGNDTVNGLNGKDVICGDAGKDKLNGGNAKDTLLGGAGKDSLNGGNGKDSLSGQGGKDVCKGGKGDDSAKKCEVEKGI